MNAALAAEVDKQVCLGAEPLRRPSPRFCSLFLSILRRRSGFERTKKTIRDGGNLINGSLERRLIRLRGFVEAADFSHKLKRSRSNLFLSNRRIEIEKVFDIPAHSLSPQIRGMN